MLKKLLSRIIDYNNKLTLRLMLVIAVLGLPFVLAYTATIYWVFRGKVQVGKFSY